MYRNSVLSLILIGCLFFVFTAGELTATGGPEVEEEKVLTIAVHADIHSLDPAAYSHRMTEGVIKSMYDGLTGWGSDMSIQPEIALEWRFVDDLTAEYKLRDDVTFHNGEPLTAEDVKFSFDRIINNDLCGASSPRKGLTGTISSVTVEDDYTVRFHLSKPWPILFKMLSHQQIIPKDYFEGLDSDPGKRCEKFEAAPVGAGSFKFVEYVPGTRLVLERYDGYYGEFPGNADKVVILVMPDEASRVAALRAGEVDFVPEVSLDIALGLEGNPDVVVTTSTGSRGRMVEMNVTKPPFDNLKARQAMNYAVDIQEIIDTLYGGKGVVFAGPLFDYEQNVDPKLVPYGYDPDKAKKLLAEAGYPDGFSLVVDAVPPHEDWATAVAGYLREAGIDATLRMWEYKVIKPELLARNRSMFVRDWGSSALDPEGYLNRKLESDSNGNFSGYSNEYFDQLLARGRSELDPEKRKEIYWEAQNIIYSEAPWIFGYSIDAAALHRPGLEGCRRHPIDYINAQYIAVHQR